MMLGLAAPQYYQRQLKMRSFNRCWMQLIRGLVLAKNNSYVYSDNCATLLNIPNPFKDNIPGRYWWLRFINRHPEVKLRKPEPLSGVLACNMNPTTVGNYFISLRDVPLKNDLLDKPQYIWNADETSICFQQADESGCPIWH